MYIFCNTSAKTMSQLSDSVLYLDLNEEQIKGIRDDKNVSNNYFYDYVIFFVKDNDIINIENKYPFLYNTIHTQDKCGMNKIQEPLCGYEFFYVGDNHEIIIECLKSLDIEQLLDDQVSEVRVIVKGNYDYKYEETIFEYDYHNEKWLTEPLIYDTYIDYNIKGSVN